MCARFTRYAPAKEILEAFEIAVSSVSGDLDFSPRYNITPTSQIFTITLNPQSGQRVLAPRHWGFCPFWSDGRYKPTNARTDQVTSNAMYRTAFAKQRCLVVASGFIEWKEETKEEEKARKRRKEPKIPHHFRVAQQEVIAFAGLYEQNDEVGPNAAFITTEPNGLVKQLHSRMPVILNREDYSRWLDPRTPPEELRSLLVPFPAPAMTDNIINPFVNKVGNEGPQCLEPVIEMDLFGTLQIEAA